MTTFLTGRELASAIEQVLSGVDVRCAVAYWGYGIDKAFPAIQRTAGRAHHLT